MKFKEGDVVIYYPPYKSHGLPAPPLKAIIRSITADGALIMVKRGTEFVKKRVVRLDNLSHP